ncbi:helix-turn-helix domain-containing protein [Sulfitobacter dubius]|uniref:helix-turn-helix domain-containing protein n=1 Tax=Sulfitobacter dubius TaxID=218673 RepID=UPI001FABECE1|nr:helix-turn-helix transcriptional regulator [Sulfitobacter dubius]
MNSKKIDPLLLALAEVLRRHRRAQQLSQEELAYRAGRSMRYISLLESGRHQPTLDTLNRISGALEFPLSQLISEAEEVVAASASSVR